jgi:glycosyltransferase involved in cell wall biosynthesis
MKIVFDHQIFGWQLYGGISRYIYELAIELANMANHELRIVSPFYVNQYLKQSDGQPKVIGIPVKYIPKTGRIIRAISFIFTWLILKYIRPDIVHETYYSSKRVAPNTSKVVLTVYDMIHERFSDTTLKAGIISSEKASAVARADHIICISEQTKQDLIDILNVNPIKISVVHLGFTLTQKNKTCVADLDRSRPFLLYVGIRLGYKNFEGSLKAYAASTKLKDEFDLICFGGGAFTSREKVLFQELGISIDRVHQISGDDSLLAEYYKAARAFVYPSLYEGFGIPPLEAMSFDCPVVCSNISSIPEVVGNAGEMFDPYDTNSMRKAIERVVFDQLLREVLINRGRERIKLFSWERCARETLEVYSKVTA